LQHYADLGAPAPARGSGVFAQHTHVSRIPLPVTLEDFYGRRLARPVGPEDRKYFAIFDIEVQISHGV
jgi:hypothetical protein